MSAHFNVVVEQEPMLFWQRLIFRGGLKISSEYVEDSDGYNKKHEEHHIKITLKRWNQLVKEIQFMDGTIYRCKNSALAEAYATSAIKLYDSLAKIENARFDVNEYEYIGRTKGGYIEQALNRFNEESSKIRDKLKTYQKNRKRYYKEVENKKVKNKQIRIPESVYINDYKTPIK